MNKKSQLLGFVLAFLVGPFGNLYGSIVGGFVMIVICVSFAALAGPLAIFCWPMAVLIQIGLIADHNRDCKLDEDANLEKDQIQATRHKELLDATSRQASADSISPNEIAIIMELRHRRELVNTATEGW